MENKYFKPIDYNKLTPATLKAVKQREDAINDLIDVVCFLKSVMVCNGVVEGSEKTALDKSRHALKTYLGYEPLSNGEKRHWEWLKNREKKNG